MNEQKKKCSKCIHWKELEIVFGDRRKGNCEVSDALDPSSWEDTWCEDFEEYLIEDTAKE